MIKKYKKRYALSKKHAYLLNYFGERAFVELSYSSKYLTQIIEWILFKAGICKDNYSDSTLTLQQIMQLLVKHYNGSQIPAIKKNSKRKYKNIPHIDERFLSFYYFDKTRLHYDRTLYRTGIYEDIALCFTGKISA